MRQDMAKVICERPRAGGRRMRNPDRVRLQNKSMEDLPRSEKIGRGGDKEFTDLLGPLRGYVVSVIGKPFAEVYSEIKKTLPGSNLSVRHTLGHLWYFLERKVFINEAGKPCHLGGGYGHEYGNLVEYGKYGPVAYVDPRDGIIKRAPKRKPYKRIKEEKPYRWIKDNLYEKLDGIWYEMKTANYTKTTEMSWFRSSYAKTKVSIPIYTDRLVGGYDVVLHSQVRNLREFDLEKAHGRKGIYAADKRQLGSREIKKLGLRGL
jgi:hypothetical protein